ncbi:MULTISPECIES: phage scaffolding protein [Mammaliicoccus]|uniref:phage scaffolding protein n=1 Tax=Mammaliicoccus TaxID=2803850 RepID=UPI00133104A5|nr:MULTISPECIES: phage scaffolding protein [Mammaliicoccus]MCJ1748573.1 phage scaffolding protein [Mammaliicoccus sciuri]WQL92594.1 phage scaffolding protein [Mammaliicoccus sciuri]
MNRQQLRDIKLSAEQIKRVMALYGQSVKQYENTKNEYYEVNEENEMLHTMNREVEKEAEKLRNNIKSISIERDYLKKEIEGYQAKINEYQIELAVLKSVAQDMYDPYDIFKIIDKDRFEINDDTGEVINLNEVLNEVRQQKKYLFKT